jgi:hypothetical protein
MKKTNGEEKERQNAGQNPKTALGMLIKSSAFYYQSPLWSTTPFCAYWGVMCWYSDD